MNSLNRQMLLAHNSWDKMGEVFNFCLNLAGTGETALMCFLAFYGRNLNWLNT